MSKRIVFILTRFSTGGAELTALQLAQDARAAGCNAELWALYRAGDFDVGDVPVRIMLPRSPRGPRDMIAMYRALTRAVASFRPVAICSLQPLSNILSAVAMAGKGRFVASQHNPADSQRFLIRWIERLVGSTRLYDGNIAVSDAVRDSYGAYGRAYLDKMTVIANGVPPLPVIEDSPTHCREYFGLPIGVPLIGAIGRLHYQKNLPFLIELVQRRSDLHLALAGDGPDEEALRAAAANLGGRVHFIGRLSGEDVTRFYTSLDIYTFPSLFEGFGRAPIEAMSCGVPVIATDMPVMREVVGDFGELQPLDVDLWLASIASILAGSASDIEAARSHAASYTPDRMSRRYRSLMLGET